MSSHTRNRGHYRYKTRITYLFKLYAENTNTETQADNAKYLAVLVSGYLEQAIKELLLHYTSQGTRQQISKYIEKSWPISKNMNSENIQKILNQFDSTWSDEFNTWLGQDENRKGHINSIVEWRNSIAHGQESKTNGVTLVSVRKAFSTVSDVVSLIENMVMS